MATDHEISSLEQGRRLVRDLFAAALEAVEPARAVRETLRHDDGAIWVGKERVSAPQGVHLVAIGKAAVSMATGALQAIDGAIATGDVITKEGHAGNPLPKPMRVFEAGHPIPDERGVRATRHMLAHLEALSAEAVVLALISGGGSALLEAPREGLTLEDLAVTTERLLRAGAPIDALNAVRAPLSRVKSGGLRAAAPDATWVTLSLSDVLGNDPRVIASGPTVPSSFDPGVALAILDRYGVRDELPRVVIRALERAGHVERESFADDDVLLVIGDNAAAVDAAADEARTRGLDCEIVWRAMQGEAADLGREFISVISHRPKLPAVVLGGGEATVTVRANGRGGRNTEFALAAGLELERRGMRDWVIASLGTDGQDAMTGLAGAIVDGGTAERARERGVDPEAALAGNDSASVFDVAEGAVVTGPTGTNVNDLYVAVRIGGEHVGRVEKGG